MLDTVARRADAARAHARRRPAVAVRRCGPSALALELALARHRADRSASSLITAIVGLPLDLYRIFGVEERFGFNRMTLALYLADLVKGLARRRGARPAAAAAGAVADAARRRALVAVRLGGAGSAFQLFMLVLYPTVIAPLFNKFSPLQRPGAARARVEELLARCGFRSRGLFVMDGSQALGARQRLLHRLRRGQAHRVLRHAARAPAAGRGRGGAGARARPLQAAPRREAHRASAVAFSFALLSLLGLLAQPAVVLRRASA